ncbi:MAG: CoB--CoM heterodisulfide reductase iron-sulfur subunit A family protein [Chloroflexi bacterium]|nr:CoB--CoM heterodisulfide reductase iron-sulfur subunit A family protein [Chloroflexota bacterium]
MTEKIGVYICHCGSNIAGVVDVAAVARWAQTNLPGVAIAQDYKFMCSSLGQEMIEKDIRELGLTRVVIAACSPHLHEATFRNACKRAGLNPYLMEMCSIREQVSWVTKDKDVATEKSKAIIAGAVKRVAQHQPLEPIFVDINPNVLVVGGGIAGIQAALEIADQGNRVYLVEREPSIGGHMAQFDKTFPTLDCAACILTPKMFTTGNHPNITLMTWSQVEKVDGFVGNFTVQIRKKARKVNTALCTGCGICEEKCPWKVVDDKFEAGMGKRKAIYAPFPQAVPKWPVIDVENCAYFKKGTCKACAKFCPTNAIDFEQQDELVSLNVGSIILATGYDLFDPKRVPQYGYGRLANVITNLEFERLSNTAGPTGGKIVLRDGVTAPETVGIVHCVGSRDVNYNVDCSAICCMQSLKFAHLVKEKTGAKVYNFYIDIRTPGKTYDEFYRRIMDEGVNLIRGKVADVTNAARVPAEEGKLIIQVEDTLVGKQVRIPVDMVILSAAMEPRADSKEVAQRFGISCSANGWFIERHPKLDPVATMTEGVFIAGVCQGPKDIPASVAQGAAAAARVMGLIGRRQVTLEPVRASVNQDQCSGCRVCNNLCPFNAITFIEDRQVSEINPALCQGCGTCVAGCPAGAITGSHFNNAQIMAQIEGLLLNFNGHGVEKETELVTA